jgi:hypothetical protein
MSEKKPITHTESEKNPAVSLTTKLHINKVGLHRHRGCSLSFRNVHCPFQFETLMDSTKPGEGSLWSEGISSEVAPRAGWKLSLYPNGQNEHCKGYISIYLHLTGPMVIALM